jgi:hypothetical protein
LIKLCKYIKLKPPKKPPKKELEEVEKRELILVEE